MKLSGKKSIQHIVTALAVLGLKEVIICPGSRNAPLTISFNRHPAFHCTSIRDERSAGFFALGKAIELKQPVAVVCTSGSAALNFAPAVSEAYYQRIPLIVLTADRPKEWTDQGDGQTINQTHIYRNFIRKSYDLKGDADKEQEFWYNERCLSEGLAIATVSDPGPVHFNIPLGEPLYAVEEVAEISTKVFREAETEKNIPAEAIANFAGVFNQSSKVMILAGQDISANNLQLYLSKLAEFNKVIVLTESTSNVSNTDFVENIDTCITHLDDKETNVLSPDLLITTGGAIVSKRIKSLLRKHKPKAHWNIHPFDAYMDTYQALTDAVSIKPEKFFEQLIVHLQNTPSSYKEQWLTLRNRVLALRKTFCKQCDFSDFKVFHNLFASLPENIVLHLSNSSPIRYAQLFNTRENVSTWCNRGTSGIDGCTSTIMGAASASPHKKFLLITGDVAFHYDINALWNEVHLNNVNIIVINNGGGGIFRIISGPGQVEEMEQFLETSMQSDAKDIAQHFGWRYLSAQDEASMQHVLKDFLKDDTNRTILEIFTEAKKNPEVLESYWKFIKENVQA